MFHVLSSIELLYAINHFSFSFIHKLYTLSYDRPNHLLDTFHVSFLFLITRLIKQVGAMDSEREGRLRTCLNGCYPSGFVGELKAMNYLAWPTVCMKWSVINIVSTRPPECLMTTTQVNGKLWNSTLHPPKKSLNWESPQFSCVGYVGDLYLHAK